MTALQRALCVGTPVVRWNKEKAPPDGGFLSLLIQPLTGYVRILDEKKEEKELKRCSEEGFLIADTFCFGNGIPRWVAREVLSQRLKRYRADMEWLDAVENVGAADRQDLVRIPRGNAPGKYECLLALKNYTLSHRYLCATISGD